MDAQQGISRRQFLKYTPVAAAAIATLPVLAGREPAAATGGLALEHATDPALLIDLTKCVGCGLCVDACKAKNDLPYRADQPWLGRDAELAASNFTVVRSEISENGQSRTVKRQCMHCLEPACASVCPVKALKKSEAGPVVYDPNKCIGCRFCLMACPFGVPSFDWDSSIGRVEKCNMCVDRVSEGRPTACAEACPSGAISFGTRADRLEEARRRIDSDPQYVREIFGDEEVGGTSVLYLSDIPFDQLGFPTGLPSEPLPEFTWKITRLVPPVATGVGIALVALYLRKKKLLEEQEEAS